MNRIDLGIYFGGSSMTVAYYRDDKSSIIVNEAGDRSTPSVLAINENEFSTGLPAKHNIIRNSKNTVCYSKHFILKNTSTVEKEILLKLDCQIKDLSANEVAFLVEKNSKPYELSLSETIEKQLKYLFDLAKTSLSVKECDAVFAVPVYFSKEQTEFLKKCAEKSGFNVLRMVKNPVAACMAYDLEDDNLNYFNVIVYQMGGNSIEVTYIRVINGLYQCVNSINLKNVGGDVFTDVVVDILCEEFIRKHKSDPKTNKRSFAKLKSNAEELKHILSTMERAHCSIDALYDGIDFDYYLTRQRFEGSCIRLYQQILQPIDDLLIANSLNENQINQVILAGAPTKMCKLQNLIRQKFSEAKISHNISPDEIVALGCAKQCSIITNSKFKKTISSDDTSFKSLACPIYLKIGDNQENNLLLKANTPLPIKKNFTFEFDLDKPYLTVIESEDRILAKVNLDSFNTKEFNLLFQIKLNDTIEVTVSETSTNNHITMFLNTSEA